MKQHSDEQLVMLVINGDQAAFEILVERYQKQIFSLAYRLGGDYDEAQDMAQEAFIRIYRELPNFDAARKFFPWMYKVAQNTCLNLLNKRPRDTSPLEDAFDLADAAESTDRPAVAYEQTERAETIRSALNKLPEQYRAPLVLKYLEGMSYQEIGKLLDLPVSTIETRLFRGRGMLKKALTAYIKQ